MLINSRYRRLPTAIKATLDEIGLNDGDINGPGGNHLKLIVADQIGFIVYETKVMNFKNKIEQWKRTLS